MPKRIPVEEKRVVLNCLISPRTREILTSMGCSQGEAVDRCAARWLVDAQDHLDAVLTPAIERQIKANVTPRLDAVGPKVSDGQGKVSFQSQSFRGPILKPSQRK